MTFLRQIQNLLERTYTPTGVNLEDCLVNRTRSEELSSLADPSAKDLSWAGRTYLRVVDGNLYVAIYYHPSVIATLEKYHPLQVLNQDNIQPLITFLEELNHAVHASLLFLENRLDIESEDSLCNLELQAKVDTYLFLKHLVAQIRRKRRILARQEQWIRSCLFENESFDYDHQQLERRYREANELGLRLVNHLNEIEPKDRVALIRELRPKTFSEKKSYINSLNA